MCRPCEAADAPGAVKVVWQLVDEYTLMEAERAMLKLLRALDKHLEDVRQAAAGSISQAPTAEATAADGLQSVPSDGTPNQSNTVNGLQAAPPSQEHNVNLQASMPNMWDNPLAGTGSTVHSQQQLAQQDSQYNITDSAPDRSQQGVQTSSPINQAVSRVAVDQKPDQAVVARSPRPTSDQQTRHVTGDASHITRDARRVTGDARRITGDARRFTGDAGTQRVTKDMQQPISGDGCHSPADRAGSFRSATSSRKEKLEYRLSHDDVYSPTNEEVQALLQQGLLNTQQLPQQLLHYGGTAASDVASNMQSGLNGMSDGGASAAVSVFAPPSVISGLSGSQAGACLLQHVQPSMLSLIAKVQNVQVRLYLMAWP